MNLGRGFRAFSWIQLKQLIRRCLEEIVSFSLVAVYTIEVTEDRPQHFFQVGINKNNLRATSICSLLEMDKKNPDWAITPLTTGL